MATGRRRGRAIIYIALILILLLVLVLVVTRFMGNNPLQQAGVGQPAASQPAANVPAAASPTPVSDMVDIIITAQDVRRGQELKDDLLTVGQIPRSDNTEGVFFTNKKDLTNTVNRAKFDLKAHTPLTNDLIVKGTDTSIPSFGIPKGRVAISIPISKLSSVSYGLQKGDHVNVLVSLLMVDLDTNFQSKLPNRTGNVVAPGPVGGTNPTNNLTAQVYGPPDYQVAAANAASYLGRIDIDPSLQNPVFVLPSEPQRPRLVTQTLIQDAVILQLGTFERSNQQSTTGNEPAQNQPAPTPAQQQQQQAQQPTPEPALPDVVTLIVSPQDAVSLNYLMLGGANLNLVMRSAGDSDTKDTEAVTLQFILDQYRIPNPAKLPYGLEPGIRQFQESGLQPVPTATVPAK